MSLPDATAGAALNQQVVQVAWLALLDFDGMPVRVTSAIKPLSFTGTGDADLDGFTFSAINPEMLAMSDIKVSDGGSETVSFTLSGLSGVNTDLMNVIGNKALWQERTARVWAIIANEAGTQQGVIWAVYTGRMSAVQFMGDPNSQTIKLDVENYLASFKEASGRTYQDQASFDSVDTVAKLTIGIANGATKGVVDAPSYSPDYSDFSVFF